jgi:hypothetical protein
MGLVLHTSAKNQDCKINELKDYFNEIGWAVSSNAIFVIPKQAG